jgi:2-methylcitrate dehydratase
MLGAGVEYDVPLPAPGEPCRAVLDSYTKEHSAEYQAQAWIDLALRLRPSLPDLQRIERVVIHTSHHTHVVIGSGSGDPQKMDPTASRETLDHSLMFIFAAALRTGFWHHVRSYAPEVVQHPDVFALWQKIQTVEDAKWTARYHAADPRAKAFGGRVEITFTDGTKLTEEIVVADAHPLGGRPFARADYVRKFRMLTDELISTRESERFLGVVPRLAEWVPGELGELNVAVDPGRLACAARDQRGIF